MDQIQVHFPTDVLEYYNICGEFKQAFDEGLLKFSSNSSRFLSVSIVVYSIRSEEFLFQIDFLSAFQ